MSLSLSLSLSLLELELFSSYSKVHLTQQSALPCSVIRVSAAVVATSGKEVDTCLGETIKQFIVTNIGGLVLLLRFLPVGGIKLLQSDEWLPVPCVETFEIRSSVSGKGRAIVA